MKQSAYFNWFDNSSTLLTAGAHHKSAQCKRGFTLIELLVAMSIVAILATIGYSIYSSAQKSGRDGKRVGDIQEIQKALEQYYTINQDYPSTLTNAGFVGYFQNNAAPKDPKDINYNWFSGTVCSPAQKKYVVCAKLESCTNLCNRTNLPSDGCQSASDGTTGAGLQYYCASSLSN